VSIPAGVLLFALLGYSTYATRYAWTVDERWDQATKLEQRRALPRVLVRGRGLVRRRVFVGAVVERAITP